jgi:exonuclease III
MCAVKSNLIICGDVNVNCHQEGDKKSQLNALLNSYFLFSVVHTPTRIYRNSVSAIDNIFIDTTKIDTYEVIAAMNGPFDHDDRL